MRLFPFLMDRYKICGIEHRTLASYCKLVYKFFPKQIICADYLLHNFLLVSLWIFKTKAIEEFSRCDRDTDIRKGSHMMDAPEGTHDIVHYSSLWTFFRPNFNFVMIPEGLRFKSSCFHFSFFLTLPKLGKISQFFTEKLKRGNIFCCLFCIEIISLYLCQFFDWFYVALLYCFVHQEFKNDFKQFC